MYGHFAFIVAFAAFASLFVIVNVAIVSRMLRPKIKDPVKDAIYECGEPTVGTAWVRFDIRFYTVAIVFLLFEVEVAFLFPWAMVFKRLRGAEATVVGLPFVFVEAAIFLIILAVALIYVWAKGDLDWVKSTDRASRTERPHPRPPPPPATADQPAGVAPEAKS